MRQKNVYFIKPVGMEGPIKIGFSDAPVSRLQSLAVWSPFQLELIGHVPGEYSDEQFLHAAFTETHSHREWFFWSEKLAGTIDEILSAGTIDVVRGKLQVPKGVKRLPRRDPWDDDRRQRTSYASRVRNAEKKLRARLGSDGAWCAPTDVKSILERWERPGRYRSSRLGKRPTEEEFGVLHSYLADPEAHSVRFQVRNDNNRQFLEAA